jgi:AcrR family transcriptional regulator
MRVYTIADLVAVTGVPPATVHYYLRHGLLPQPKRASASRFLYDERHEKGLRLIRMLRERRGLSLDMIRRIMPELLRLEAEEAFRPEMWDRAVAPRLSGRRLPSTRVLEAAKEAFAKRGYGDVNVDDICRSARIAKGSFYRHYRSKEDLFLAAAESVAADTVERFAGAVSGEPVKEVVGGEILAGILEPRLIMFLDLLARSLLHRPGYPSAARRVCAAVTAGIGRNVQGPGSPEERGGRALAVALRTIVGRTLAWPDIDPSSGADVVSLESKARG